MKQVRIHGPGDVRVDDVEEVPPGPRDAVVRIRACGICGTDLSFVTYGAIAGKPGVPMPIGHEMSGTVEQVGDAVTGFRVGDPVVVLPGNDTLGRIGCGTDEGGMAPRLLVREADVRLFRAPAGVDLRTAALVEPLAVGMNAANQADAAPGEPVAVFGCGPVGLAAVATFADRGHPIVAVDTSARRRDLALEFGAQHALDPTSEDIWTRLGAIHGTVPTMFGPAPATAAYVEATGVADVVTDLVNHARGGATIAVVAVHQTDLAVSGLMLMVKELTVRGAMEYPARFEDAIELLERRDLSAMITHDFGVDDVGEAIALLQSSKECGKVLITFEED